MQPDWKTRDEERFPKEGETIFQANKRVIDYWREHQSTGVFDEFPKILADEYPDIFGQFDEDKLGTICAAIWLYMGQPVNKGSFLKWFRESVPANK